MRVFVENLEFVGRHGVYPEERAEGRLFRVDVAAELEQWATDDEVSGTLDYRRLIEYVLDVGRGESLQLVETMARRIIDRAFSNHDEITHISLTIRKRATGLDGDPEWVGASFEIERAAWRPVEV
jgi:dihydroneopterin aldolase